MVDDNNGGEASRRGSVSYIIQGLAIERAYVDGATPYHRIPHAFQKFLQPQTIRSKAVSRYLKWTLERDESTTEIEIEYSYRAGTPDSYSPLYGAEGGDPAEHEIENVYSTHDNSIKDWEDLTEKEQDSINEHIAENPPEPDYGDDYD